MLKAYCKTLLSLAFNVIVLSPDPVEVTHVDEWRLDTTRYN
jgi:hypothetical protein